jgi:hypothetical protein
MSSTYERDARERIIAETLNNPIWKRPKNSHYNNFQGEIPSDPADPPLKKIFGLFDDKKFLFDRNTAIPLVTDTSVNFATCIARKVHSVPNEAKFYIDNSHIDDVDVLIAKAIPVVAEILYYESQFRKHGFDDEVNRHLCLNHISKTTVESIARRIPSYRQLSS